MRTPYGTAGAAAEAKLLAAGDRVGERRTADGRRRCGDGGWPAAGGSRRRMPPRLRARGLHGGGMRLARTLGVVLWLSSAALTGQAFVVDANNGPGAHFTSIAAAVAAVPEGAVLLVRPGVYGGFAVGKTLRILGEHGADLAAGANVAITGLGAHQTVVVRNLRALGGGAWHVDSCQGPVFLERCSQAPGQLRQLAIVGCQQVAVRNYSFGTSPAFGMLQTTLTNGHAVFESCQLGRGDGSSFGPGTGPGLVVTGGTLQLVDCVVRAGGVHDAGLSMANAQVRLLGTTSVAGGLTQGHALVGTGTLRHEPTVAFTGALPHVPLAVATTVGVMPRLTTVPNLSGDQYFARLYGPPGHLAAIALALPGPPVALAGVIDPVWLDPGTVGGLVAAVLTTSPFVWNLQTPAAGQLLGVRATWQGVTYDPAVGFQLSNPSFSILP